jgi:DNA primase
MSQLSFTEAAERIKSSLDIVDIIQRYVSLKKKGRNYAGICPFHKDHTPSLDVVPLRGLFICRACGVGGDSLTFLMKIENKSYGQAIRDLAEEQGIEITDEGPDSDAIFKEKNIRQKTLDLNYVASQWFRERLQDPAASAVQEYLAKRYPDKILRKQVVETFQLGYAPPGWENLTPFLKKHFEFIQAEPSFLVEAGLSNSRENGFGLYDKFRNRLIIPILDEKGYVVAFGGRSLNDDDKPKYLNSSETVVYTKSHILYGLYQARESIRQNKAAVVMEGYFDVISAHLGGITEAVGSCGTALTDSHIKLMARYGAKTIYLAFDSDKAGLNAAVNAINLLQPYVANDDLQVKAIIVPNGKDPDDFIRQHGGAAFRALTETAQHFLPFKLDVALRDLDLQTPDGRIAGANRISSILADLNQPNARIEYIHTYAERLGISEQALQIEVSRLINAKKLFSPKPWSSFEKSGDKKAISKSGSTSLKRQKPQLTDNILELRAPLAPQHIAAEKNLLMLTLSSPESFSLMMSVLAQQPSFSFDNPAHQEILAGLLSLTNNPENTKINPSANGFLGTLIEKMNHLYFDKPDVIHTFAELALNAETFCESLGLSENQGPQQEERISTLAQEQLKVLSHWRRRQQLMLLKTNASQSASEQVELTYAFHDRLQEPPGQFQNQPQSPTQMAP